MTYFVYKVFPGNRLELVNSLGKYRDAKELARSMRTEIRTDDDYAVRIIFAKNSDEAQRLLTEKREPRPVGEE